MPKDLAAERETTTTKPPRIGDEEDALFAVLEITGRPTLKLL